MSFPRGSLYRPNDRQQFTFWLAVILGVLLGLALSADAAEREDKRRPPIAVERKRETTAYRVCWISPSTGASGCGSPTTSKRAKEWADALNVEVPDVKHFVVKGLVMRGPR